MPATALRRALVTLVPAALLIGFGASTLWGERGVLERDRLATRLASSHDEQARIDRQNHRLIRELLLWEDPLAQERRVAERLGWAKEGSVLVRFDAPR